MTDVRYNIRIGEQCGTSTQLEDLPPGAVIAQSMSASQRYSKGLDGMWTDCTRPSRTFNSHQFNGGNYMLVAVPEGAAYEPPPPLTLRQYKWEIRDGALLGVTMNGVSLQPSLQALAEAGAPDHLFPLGAGVRIKDTRTRDDLPVGTVVFAGSPNSGITGMWKKGMGHGAWVALMGTAATPPTGGVFIHTYDGKAERPEWVDEQYTPEMEAEILRFKADLWRVGWQLKRNQSWCGTYENVMRGLGLTSAVLRQIAHNGIRVGDAVNPDMAKTMPVGTVFKWSKREDPENDWAFYVRTPLADDDNAAGTRRICGTSTEMRNYRSSMRVAALVEPNGHNMAWPVDRALLDEHLPVGTVFVTEEGALADESNGYRKNLIDSPGGRMYGQRHTTAVNWTIGDFGTNPSIFVTAIEGITR